MRGMPWPRVIVHADMDAFYAAVEQLDRPELRGKPVIIGHPGRRGVVATASYEARPFGVGSAMPMARARKLCPQGIIVPPRFERYQEVSRLVMDAFASFSPRVEALSLDEAFLDMTGAEGLFGPPSEMGRRIKAKVKEVTGGLTVSVGVAPTKYVAKVASDVRKPDGLTVVPDDEVRAFLDPLPIRRLWGVGPKTEPQLHRLGLRTIGDVARAGRTLLVSELGALGEHIDALSRGEDPRDVEPDRDAKSLSHEETLEWDIRGPEAVRPYLLRAADTVAARLREAGLLAGGVRVKLKTASFRLMTRQTRLERPTDSAPPLYEAGLSLLESFEWDEPLRLVGLGGTKLSASAALRQGELFAPESEQRQARLDRTLDRVRDKFGDGALKRASDLDEK
jgi:DNA polymerase IV